jgi:hypothetical protein
MFRRARPTTYSGSACIQVAGSHTGAISQLSEATARHSVSADKRAIDYARAVITLAFMLFVASLHAV